MASPDYYETLGVARGAKPNDIRKAYRRLARKFHPDLNPGDKSAEERFKKIQEAYDILGDPKKKQMYDQFGFYSASGAPGGQEGFRAGPEMGFGGFDFSDLFSGAGSRATGGSSNAFRDMFSQFFSRGAHGTEARGPERGSDLEYGLSVDFWQAIRGTQVRLDINRQEVCDVCGGSGKHGGQSAVCPECNGSGTVTQIAGAMRFSLSCPRCGGQGRLRDSCEKCHGDGRLSKAETVEVRIPQGVKSGDRLRVPGKGNSGAGGGAAGDLYITVRVEPHPFFQREGDDIEIRVPVTVSETGLGAKIEVPTIDGRALLKVPQGTHSGQRFRLREKGVFNARKGVRGDQIVEVLVQSPKVRDERTKEILRELATLNPEDPRAELWSKV
ncbi:MAG TPA: molecular chaperone DnaJ [Bryobacteraceae bacterium]|nr:molecular chaperone DnaJ [Bryobacteraceae bacterium]